MYFDKKGTIKRLTPLESDSNKEEFTSVVGLQNIEINVQPANPESTALSDGVFGKTYTVFTTHSGIKEGDRVTVSGAFTDGISINKELNVSAIGNWNFQPMPHFEITCTEIVEE